MEHNFIENELVILSKATIDRLLQYDNVADLIAVYTFYYYTAKWQQTNQPKATNEYVVKGLKISRARVSDAKERLQAVGLIEPVQTRNKQGKVTGWYIKLNYIWGEKAVQNIMQPEVVLATSGKEETNALSANNINALSTNILTTGKLPDSRGKTYILRVLSIYNDLFRNKYGFSPQVSIPRFGKALKELLQSKTELQAAALLICFFDWRGMTGQDTFAMQKLLDANHNFSWFFSTINTYEAYLRNVFGLAFDDELKVKEFVAASMTSLKNDN